MEGKQKWIVGIVVWTFVILVLGVGYRYWVVPNEEAKAKLALEAKKKADESAKQNKIVATSTQDHYDHEVNLGIDSFTGYAVFRSQEFRRELASRKVNLKLVDDGADYPKRLEALRSGQTQMAVFTIDALIKTSAAIGDLPATIVQIIDETKGADGMVGYKSKYPNLDSLNDPNTMFVLTPDSPSETLSRVMLANFTLPRVNPNPFVPAKDAKNVYNIYRNSKPTDDKVYVLWEPFISKMLENPNMHVIIDSSRFRGYIVDVLVVSRDFLIKNPEVVQLVEESYFRAAYNHQGRMPQLVLKDAADAGEALNEKQVDRLVNGIWWKNVQENYAHMGISPNRDIQNIEDVIANITSVLLKSNAIQKDPTDGKPNLLFYNKTLQTLSDSGFHPGTTMDSTGKVRNDTILPALTDAQWESLQPIGTLNVDTIQFVRGTSRLTDSAIAILDKLVENLNTWTTYYVTVKGDASRVGDPEANKALAESRAKTATEYLIHRGIDANRIRPVAGSPSGQTSVNFILGQVPY